LTEQQGSKPYSNQRNCDNQQRIESPGAGQIPVQKAMGRSQPAATRALQPGHSMKEATRIKRMLVWREKVQDQSRSHCPTGRH